MLQDFLRPYISDQQMIDRVAAVLEFEYYGVTVPMLSLALFVLMAVTFIWPRGNQRTWVERLGDFLIVWLCVILLLICMAVGTAVGKQYDQMALGAFGGLFVFWLIFNMIGTIKNNIKKRKEREALAKSLASRH